MLEYIKAYSTQNDNYLKVHRSFIEKVLGFTQGQRGILSNGRVSDIKMAEESPGFHHKTARNTFQWQRK